MRQAISGFNKEDLEAIMNNLETSDTPTINYLGTRWISNQLEFMAATMERSLYLKEERLYQVFKLLDCDGNGKISRADLEAATKGHTFNSSLDNDMLKNYSSEFW
jgi:calcium-dependent protein kinase